MSGLNPDLVLEELECDHLYALVSDEVGDPQVTGGYADASYMQCADCGHTRDIEDADERQWREEAARDRWNERRDALIDIMTPVRLR